MSLKPVLVRGWLPPFVRSEMVLRSRLVHEGVLHVREVRDGVAFPDELEVALYVAGLWEPFYQLAVMLAPDPLKSLFDKLEGGVLREFSTGSGC